MATSLANIASFRRWRLHVRILHRMRMSAIVSLYDTFLEGLAPILEHMLRPDKPLPDQPQPVKGAN
jgi:hypothetical protein